MIPAPSTKHQTVLGSLHFQLYALIHLTKLGRVYVAPFDVELSEHDIVQPDLTIVMNDRYGIVTPKRIIGVPNLAVEVLSESNPAHDRVLKFEMYQRCKLPEYWIVDPESELIEQWVLDTNQSYQRLGVWTESFASPTIPEQRIDLRTVWEQT